jgi:hypothetical protein
MLFTCTLKDGIVYVPTIVKTEAGFYMHHEPVAVVPVANTDALWRAFHDVMEKGNEIVPTPNVRLSHHLFCRNTLVRRVGRHL